MKHPKTRPHPAVQESSVPLERAATACANLATIGTLLEDYRPEDQAFIARSELHQHIGRMIAAETGTVRRVVEQCQLAHARSTSMKHR